MKARILRPTPENLTLVAEAILRNEVVGMPTETVYGLAGNARSPVALMRIFETKDRPTLDPLILHVGFQAKRVSQLEHLNLVDGSKISTAMRSTADQLIEAFWPGPLTLILPKHPEIPELATSGLPTVALRMPRHSIAQALIAATQCPLAAPSANRFGRISPTTPEAVVEELGERIDWVLDGGPTEIGVESTVVAVLESGEIQVLRPGGTSVEEIEKKMGQSRLVEIQKPSEGFVLAPGMLASHYAPSKRLFLLPKRVSELQPEDITLNAPISAALKALPSSAVLGVLLLSGPPVLATRLQEITGFKVLVRTLSRNGDLAEAAHHLFAEMRWLDSSEVGLIFAEPCQKDTGLGFAITDRLKRASFAH